MRRYLWRRTASALATTIVAVAAVFVAMRVLPNNPVLVQFGQHAVPESVTAEMSRQGWDQPIAKQLATFAVRAIGHGDLGTSFETGEDVAAGLARTFPATVELALAALLIAIPCGIGLGIAAAVWRGGLPDLACTSIALVGVSVPVFFLGICLMMALPNMPTGRRLPVGMEWEGQTQFILLESLLTGRWHVFAEGLRYLCLPALALSTVPLALIARITRSSMLEVLKADYVRTARAKGASPLRVILRHALPNAWIPIVNVSGLQVGQLLTGAVLTESVFDWPGLGRYVVNAVLKSDNNVVQGATLLVALVYVVINLGVDVLHALLDPRVSSREAPHA